MVAGGDVAIWAGLAGGAVIGGGAIHASRAGNAGSRANVGAVLTSRADVAVALL